MRTAFSDSLIDLAMRNHKLVLLTGDHGYSLFDNFRKQCPAQYFNCGIAEQNMVGIAAGLAKSGFRPIVYGLAAFIPVRVLEQIKIDVCYENLPVIFIGDGAGVVYSYLGTSHQSTEDIACLRAIPQMIVLSPADRYEMTAVMESAFKKEVPTYIRIGKSDKDNVHAKPFSYEIGELINLSKGGGGIAIIATGSMTSTALELVSEFPDIEIWSAPSIKPIATDVVVDICKRNNLIITLEEHSVYGGLGSCIAEISTTYAPTRICRLGIDDKFSEYCGSYDYLISQHNLDVKTIKSKIHKINDNFVDI